MTDSSTNWVIAGVDTGGTFTDFTIFDGERVRVHKVLSTPDAPERAILEGLKDLGLGASGLRLRHGSTVATNAVLEGKGARTVYITNHGLGDVLTIGRQNRSRLYDLSPAAEVPPVPRELCLETGGRLAADGSVVVPLAIEDVDDVLRQIELLAPEAVAINLLFSFIDPGFEKALEAALPDELFVSRSSAVLAEIGEYERGIATWLNACIGPRTGRYLEQLADRLPGASVSVMQSSGLTVDADQAASLGVHLLLSGPAGGLSGAMAVGRMAGFERMLTLDVGGTSTDVSLLDGGIQLTRTGRIASYPVAVPMVDMHTIGAGGGSLARVDDLGLLHVGPVSAGADPGPACYGRGGKQPTVTDANLILGRIPSCAGLGGALRLDLDKARLAMQRVAEPLGLSIEESAAGVIRLANEHMAGALRVISVERGHDPRDFALCCFGGAGGLHACELAELLEMRQVLIPIHAGVLSALGMLFSPPGREVTRAVLSSLSALDERSLAEAFSQLADPVIDELKVEGVRSDDIELSLMLDLRYSGQSGSLTVPWTDPKRCSTAFHRAHRQRFGHDLDQAIEVVCLRVRVLGTTPRIPLIPASPAPDRGLGPGHWRDGLVTGQVVRGPCAVLDDTGTTWIAEGWEGRVDHLGNLLLARR